MNLQAYKNIGRPRQMVTRESDHLPVNQFKTNVTDWCYLLPQTIQPPYLHVMGPNHALTGTSDELRGEQVETFIPLWSGGTKSLQRFEHFAARGDSYPLVVWELAINYPIWFMSSKYLIKTFERIRDLTAKGGYIYIAVRQSVINFCGVYPIMDLVRHTGFCNIQAYYVLPSHSYPMHFVPVNEPQLMRYYLEHVAIARSVRRKRVLELAWMLERLRLGKMLLRVVPCFSIVAERG